VARAGSALKQAEADERSGHDGVQVTLAETWTRLRDAVERVQVQQKFLEAAEARAAIARAQYSNGLISFDTWTIIENDLVQADQTLLDARADALIAEANWIRAQGGTLEHAD
jgi:outer membrane protein TolC